MKKKKKKTQKYLDVVNEQNLLHAAATTTSYCTYVPGLPYTYNAYGTKNYCVRFEFRKSRRPYNVCATNEYPAQIVWVAIYNWRVIRDIDDLRHNNHITMCDVCSKRHEIKSIDLSFYIILLYAMGSAYTRKTVGVRSVGRFCDCVKKKKKSGFNVP